MPSLAASCCKLKNMPHTNTNAKQLSHKTLNQPFAHWQVTGLCALLNWQAILGKLKEDSLARLNETYS